MATLGRVVVDLIARTANFQAGMTRAQGMMAGFQRGVNGMVMSLATRLAPAAAAAFAFRELRGAAEEIERVSKASAKLGVSAADYQVLAKTADETGTSVEAMAAAIGKAVRGVGQAQLSGKAGAFGELGLDPDKLAKMSRLQVFQTIVDRLGGVKNEFKRAAVAQEIFGKGAGELSAFVNGGVEALDRYRKEISDTGQTIDVFSEASTRVFSEEWEKTMGAFKGWWTEAWGVIAPGMTKLIIFLQMVGTSFTIASKLIGAGIFKIGEGFGKVLSLPAAVAAAALPEGKIKDFMTGVAGVAESTAKFAKGTSGELMDSLDNDYLKFAGLLGEILNTDEMTTDKMKELAKQRGAAGGRDGDVSAAGKFKAHATEFKEVSSLSSLAQFGSGAMNRVGGKQAVEWGRGEALLEEIAENTGGLQPVLA